MPDPFIGVAAPLLQTGLFQIKVVLRIPFGRPFGERGRKIGIVVVHAGSIAGVPIRPQDVGAAVMTGIRLSVRTNIPESGTDRKTPLVRQSRTADCIRDHDRTGGLLDPAEFGGIEIAPGSRETAGNIIKLYAVTDLPDRGAGFGIILELIHIIGPGEGFKRIAVKNLTG